MRWQPGARALGPPLKIGIRRGANAVSCPRRHPCRPHVHALAPERHALRLEQPALALALGQRAVRAHHALPGHVGSWRAEHRAGVAGRLGAEVGVGGHAAGRDRAHAVEHGAGARRRRCRSAVSRSLPRLPEAYAARMRIGIVGAGRIVGDAGRLFARAGHEVMFSGSRDPAKLEGLAREAGGARTGSPREAVEFGDVGHVLRPLAGGRRRARSDRLARRPGRDRHHQPVRQRRSGAAPQAGGAGQPGAHAAELGWSSPSTR